MRKKPMTSEAKLGSFFFWSFSAYSAYSAVKNSGPLSSPPVTEDHQRGNAEGAQREGRRLGDHDKHRRKRYDWGSLGTAGCAEKIKDAEGRITTTRFRLLYRRDADETAIQQTTTGPF